MAMDFVIKRPEGLHLERPALRFRRAGDQDRRQRRRQGRDAVHRREQPARLSTRRNLEKIGMKAQDTSELFFDNIRIPATNMLGHEARALR